MIRSNGGSIITSGQDLKISLVMEIFYPAFLLMFHTLCILGFMGYRRYTSVARREVSANYYQAYQGEEPQKLRILSRHLVNLL